MSNSPNNQPPRPPAGRPPYTGETLVMRRVEHKGSRQGPPPPPSNPPHRATPKRRRWPLGWIALGIVAIVALALGFGYWQIHRLAQRVVVADPRGLAIASPLLGANILVVGVDIRRDHPEEGIRSDTLMLVRLDGMGGWTNLLSIPRDTQVDLPNRGPSKINAAYAYGYYHATELYGDGVSAEQGGMAFAADTVSRFLNFEQRGMRVDYVVQIDFDGFAALIDALGGITIDVPRRIVDNAYPTPDYGVMQVIFEPGPQRMDGARALIYARTRHADNDFGRTERQQQVVQAIVNEIQQRNWFERMLLLPRLLDAVTQTGDTPAILTTLPLANFDTLLAMGRLAANLDPALIGRYRIEPGTVAVRENDTNLIWDASDVAALVNRWLTPPGEASEQARVQVLNGAGVVGLARRTSEELSANGFTVLAPADAPPGDYPRTVVYQAGNAPFTARRLAQLLGAEVVVGKPAEVYSEAEIVVILGRDRTP
ncbi:LCP family protein [Chloroflexus sp.]|uniref:LCP family protein n=1 Tax=Chloroflexus sp. TaxID=1904827 RepID=UPI002ACD56D8|nr:LCP family protein [Chloroflexus sp.]